MMHIYIFSYNRGIFLENSIKSVFECAPDCAVTIVDDDSNDEFTISVLNKYKDRLNLIDGKNIKGNKNILGGLYNNMRFAFADAREKGYEYILFLQDDMQLVRKINNNDINFIDKYFKENKRSAQLFTCFMKKFIYNKDSKFLEVDSSQKAYLRPQEKPGFSGFSAVGVFHVNRFFELFDSLLNNEYDNNEFAKSNDVYMGLYVYPFMMYLPSPPSYRGRVRSLPLKIIEWLGGTGFYPYSFMDEITIDKLFNRDIAKDKPVAEQWLLCPPVQHLDVWSFSGGITKLRERGGWRRWLGELLTKINKWR